MGQYVKLHVLSKNLSWIWFWAYQQGHTSIFFSVGAKSCERTGQVLGNLTNMIPSDLHPTAETQRMTYTRIRWLFCVLRFQAPQPLLQWHWHSSHSHRQRRQFVLRSRHHQSPSWTVVCVNVKVIQSQSTSLKLIITQPFDFFSVLQSEDSLSFH